MTETIFLCPECYTQLNDKSICQNCLSMINLHKEKANNIEEKNNVEEKNLEVVLTKMLDNISIFDNNSDKIIRYLSKNIISNKYQTILTIIFINVELKSIIDNTANVNISKILLEEYEFNYYIVKYFTSILEWMKDYNKIQFPERIKNYEITPKLITVNPGIPIDTRNGTIGIESTLTELNNTYSNTIHITENSNTAIFRYVIPKHDLIHFELNHSGIYIELIDKNNVCVDGEYMLTVWNNVETKLEVLSSGSLRKFILTNNMQMLTKPIFAEIGGIIKILCRALPGEYKLKLLLNYVSYPI